MDIDSKNMATKSLSSKGVGSFFVPSIACQDFALDEVRDILQLTSHAMLRAVRVVLANGSLAEARDLQKMLTKAISVVEEEWNAKCNAPKIDRLDELQGT